jgi:hypothetical protein
MYEPMLHVAQRDGSIKTLTIKGKWDYQPEEARRLLSEVGLKLYDAASNLEKHPEGVPLSVGQMAVKVAPVQTPPASVKP